VFLRLVVGCAAILAVARCGSLAERDYLCELTVAHLAECCPNFPTRLNCTSLDDGCGSHTSLPVLRVDESECILDLDCPEIEDAGLCTRVLSLPPAAVQMCPPPPPPCTGLFCGFGGSQRCTWIDTSLSRAPICL
jgi:hypothetical protein